MIGVLAGSLIVSITGTVTTVVFAWRTGRRADRAETSAANAAADAKHLREQGVAALRQIAQEIKSAGDAKGVSIDDIDVGDLDLVWTFQQALGILAIERIGEHGYVLRNVTERTLTGVSASSIAGDKLRLPSGISLGPNAKSQPFFVERSAYVGSVPELVVSCDQLDTAETVPMP